MWRSFGKPVPADLIRKDAKAALEEVLAALDVKETRLSRDLFNCPSALTRFLKGGEFSVNRLEILVNAFDAALGVEEEETPSYGVQEGQADED